MIRGLCMEIVTRTLLLPLLMKSHFSDDADIDSQLDDVGVVVP